MFSLWRKARRENSAASRLLGSTSLRFALHGWQRMKVSDQERYEMIQRHAYFLAEARNFHPGHEQDDWPEAERFVDEMLKKR
ncbi:DUF2934 domain-containing protein [Thiolapillus sp.]|uniref:DUF2934 domain-containing protein n=1 Tax=Thiolapillus sp. TaxID=2017437 RepID=UPI003AF4104E